MPKVMGGATIHIDLRQECERGDAQSKEKRLGGLGASVLKMLSIDDAFWDEAEDLVETHKEKHGGDECAVITIDVELEKESKDALNKAQQLEWLRKTKSWARFCQSALKIAAVDDALWGKLEDLIQIYKEKHKGDNDRTRIKAKEKAVITVSDEDGRITTDIEPEREPGAAHSQVQTLAEWGAMLISVFHNYLNAFSSGINPHLAKWRHRVPKAVVTISDEGDRITIGLEPKRTSKSMLAQAQALAYLTAMTLKMVCLFRNENPGKKEISTYGLDNEDHDGGSDGQKKDGEEDLDYFLLDGG